MNELITVLQSNVYLLIAFLTIGVGVIIWSNLVNFYTKFQQLRRNAVIIGHTLFGNQGALNLIKEAKDTSDQVHRSIQEWENAATNSKVQDSLKKLSLESAATEAAEILRKSQTVVSKANAVNNDVSGQIREVFGDAPKTLYSSLNSPSNNSSTNNVGSSKSGSSNLTYNNPLNLASSSSSSNSQTQTVSLESLCVLEKDSDGKDSWYWGLFRENGKIQFPTKKTNEIVFYKGKDINSQIREGSEMFKYWGQNPNVLLIPGKAWGNAIATQLGIPTRLAEIHTSNQTPISF